MTPDAPPLLEAVDVSKAFGAVRALAGTSVALHAGELVGLVGPDGAGKTSLIRALTGLMNVDSGTASIEGVPWARAPRSSRESLGYMPQRFALYPDLSVDENLEFFGAVFGLSRRTFEERRARLLEMTRLAPARDRPAGALSGGMYKKLAIACALLHSPRALVLDEPTNGVDPVSRRELWALLYELVDDGVGVLVATPYMDEAARCTRLLLLAEGTVLAEGTPSTLVATLDDPVLDVGPGATREALESIEAHPGVLATAPSGDGVRLLVAKERAPEVAKLLDALRLASRTADPTLEDLFLSKMQRRRAGAKS